MPDVPIDDDEETVEFTAMAIGFVFDTALQYVCVGSFSNVPRSWKSY